MSMKVIDGQFVLTRRQRRDILHGWLYRFWLKDPDRMIPASWQIARALGWSKQDIREARTGLFCRGSFKVFKGGTGPDRLWVERPEWMNTSERGQS